MRSYKLDTSRMFILLLTDESNGKQIHHFRSVKVGVSEIKIFFTVEKVLMFLFEHHVANLIDAEVFIRSPYDSLLPFETMAQQRLGRRPDA